MNASRNTKMSGKHLWLFVAIVGVVLVAALATGSAGYLLFVIPCMLMMGAMMWMMMGGMGNSGGGQVK